MGFGGVSLTIRKKKNGRNSEVSDVANVGKFDGDVVGSNRQRLVEDDDDERGECKELIETWNKSEGNVNTGDYSAMIAVETSVAHQQVLNANVEKEAHQNKNESGLENEMDKRSDRNEGDAKIKVSSVSHIARLVKRRRAMEMSLDKLSDNGMKGEISRNELFQAEVSQCRGNDAIDVTDNLSSNFESVGMRLMQQMGYKDSDRVQGADELMEARPNRLGLGAKPLQPDVKQKK
eukprot:CAMPEP_0182445936 /NCGR_PEP_ID=MMETSP1172-20130603/3878_1 /TAXON_ID=708627 /ORGANISM="Timspurckia oligopyrenoides, Strain CCMP3278" /LENGTH=233 /DNA_ID=CAMNT_0024641775 /DNA_START=40 /DNA_END=741 /DNA_ORIENTATION=+